MRVSQLGEEEERGFRFEVGVEQEVGESMVYIFGKFWCFSEVCEEEIIQSRRQVYYVKEFGFYLLVIGSY